MKLTKKHINKFIGNIFFHKLDEEIKKLPRVSFLFVTYNRCPYADPEKNPLVWSFQTLINNDYYKIYDYVVIDDYSRDYTSECIEWLRNKYGININYIKNKNKKECSYSRKVGLLHTKNKLVLMGDDDCLYNKYFLIGSVLTYFLLKKRHPEEKIAVVNFPVYEKSLYPNELVPLGKIGKMLFEKAFFYHEFEKFPYEYLKQPRYLDKYKILLKPFEVDTFKGVNLCDKNLILKAGNYPDLSMWKYGYSEHIELSTSLNLKKLLIYHQSDPKISCIHLKYGAKTRDRFDKRFYNKKIKGLRYPLGKMIDMAEITNYDTGTRSPDKLFHIIKIGSFLSFYLKISENLGIKFSENEYKTFVQKGKIFSTTPSGIIKEKSIREKIFFKGIRQGIKAAEIQTGKNYSRAHKKIIDKISEI